MKPLLVDQLKQENSQLKAQNEALQQQAEQVMRTLEKQIQEANEKQQQAEDKSTYYQEKYDRVLEPFGFNCQVPLGVHTEILGEEIRLHLFLSNLEMTHYLEKKESFPLPDYSPKLAKFTQEIRRDIDRLG